MKKQTLTANDAARRAAFMKHVRRAPKMPPEQQRRLQELLERQDRSEITRAESAELRRLLKEVDQKTIEMLEHAAEQAAQELGSGNGRAHHHASIQRPRRSHLLPNNP